MSDDVESRLRPNPWERLSFMAVALMVGVSGVTLVLATVGTGMWMLLER
jgi:hypothetical protein